jgi:hypothetical protein
VGACTVVLMHVAAVVEAQACSTMQQWVTQTWIGSALHCGWPAACLPPSCWMCCWCPDLTVLSATLLQVWHLPS